MACEAQVPAATGCGKHVGAGDSQMRTKAFSISLKTISSQLLMGFGAVVVVGGIAGTIAITSIVTISHEFEQYEDMASDALLASELNSDMAKVLLNTREYLATRSEDDLQSSRAYLKEVTDGVAHAKTEIDNPARRALVEKIDSELKVYASGLDRLVEIYKERDRLVDEVIDVIGPKVRKGFTEINRSATQDGDLETANLTGQVQEHMMLARLYMTNFLLQNHNQDLDRAHEELATVKGMLGVLEGSVDNPKRKQTLSEIIPTITQFDEAVTLIGKVIEERNTIRENTVSRIGTEINGWAAEIKKSATEDEEKIAAETKAIVATSELMTLATNLLGLVAALAIAWFMGRRLSRPIAQMTTAMQTLAAGEMETEIPARDRADEIGAMAAACRCSRTTWSRPQRPTPNCPRAGRISSAGPKPSRCAPGPSTRRSRVS